MVAYNQPIILVLTIPTGATTGTRIVIDGVNGVIDVFDASNIKTVEIGDGIIVIGKIGFPSIVLTATGTDFLGGQAANIDFPTGSPNERVEGSIYGFYEQSQDFMGTVIDGPGSVNNQGHWEIVLGAGSSFGLQPAFGLTFYSDNTFTTGTSVISAFKSGGTTPLIVVNTAWPIVSETVWTNLTLVNGWAAAGGAFAPPSYRLMPDGTVMLRGLLTGGTNTNGTTITTLPTGRRPLFDTRVICQADTTIAPDLCNLQILPTGLVNVFDLGTSHAISLDGVRFSII